MWVKDNVASLEFTGALSTPAGDDAVKIQGTEAKVSVKGEQSGTFLLDLKTGWIIRMEVTQKSVQDADVAGQKMHQKIELKVTVTAD